MEGLDPFFKDLATTDTKKKIAHGETIIKENIIYCQFVYSNMQVGIYQSTELFV